MKTTFISKKWLIVSSLLILFGFVIAIQDSTALAASLVKPSSAPPHSDHYILTSSDDARQTELFGGTLSLQGHHIFAGDFGMVPSFVGLRFNSVTVSQGTTISQAFIRFKASGSSYDFTTLNIHGHDVDHSPPFLPGNGPADRQGEFTSAQVAWYPEFWNEGQVYYSDDIAPIIQEIIDRPGWYEGNAISLIITDGDGLNNVIRKFIAFDLDPAWAAKLVIVYPESAASSDDIAVEDPAKEPSEGMFEEFDPVLCLISPECVIVSGLAGLILLVIGGGLGWFVSGRMRLSTLGKLFFAVAGGAVGGVIGAVVVGGFVSAGLSASIASAPSTDTTDTYFCEAYFKTQSEAVKNEVDELVDVLISNTVPSNVALPPNSRFHIAVWDQTGGLHEFVTTDQDISLADAGLSPSQIGDQLLWQTEVEALTASGDQFLPICTPGGIHVFNVKDLVSCDGYLKTHAVTIGNSPEEVTDIVIYIAVPGDVTLPPNSRFRITVKDIFGDPRDIITNNTSVSLAAAGLFPDLVDSPLIWQVSIEHLAGVGGDLFLPTCVGDTFYEFDFNVPGQEQLAFTPEAPTFPTPSFTTLPPTPLPPVPPTATTPHEAADTKEPKVSGASASPNPALTTSPVTISATISDSSGVARAIVYIKTGKGAYQSMGNMKSGGGNNYFLNIGTLTPAGTYTFAILAEDTLGNANCSTGNLDDCPGGSFVVNIP